MLFSLFEVRDNFRFTESLAVRLSRVKPWRVRFEWFGICLLALLRKFDRFIEVGENLPAHLALAGDTGLCTVTAPFQ